MIGKPAEIANRAADHKAAARSLLQNLGYGHLGVVENRILDRAYPSGDR